MKSIELGKLAELNYEMKEALRAIRTNLTFCGDDVRVIQVTSSMPNEGKSTMTMEIARAIAESGRRVVVIDTDMRKSVLVGRHKIRSKEGEMKGLSHYLSGNAMLKDVLFSTNVPGMFMILSGKDVPNSTELLENPYFDDLIRFCRKTFDYVLLDCAPINLVIDSAVIAKKSDGLVLVIAQGTVPVRAIRNGVKQLQNSGVRILGVVLNKFEKQRHSLYSKYYGKYDSGYYGSYYGTYYGNEDGNN